MKRELLSGDEAIARAAVNRRAAHADGESERFMAVGRAYEQFYLDLARLSIAAAKRVYGEEGEYTIRAEAGNAGGPLVEIDWSDPGLRVYEKIDGTCIILYWDADANQWHAGTRSVPEADLPINAGKLDASCTTASIMDAIMRNL